MSRIKIRKLTIHGFKGIRYEQTIDFTSRHESLLLFGANAKGKSSIGDAFEWFFKGEVKELTREGCTRDDYRHRLLDETDDTVVKIDFSDPILNSDFRLNASRRQVYANDSDEFKEYLRDSITELLLLRHKDLKAFVDETKGEKRQKISQLIGMEGWEIIRNDMVAVENRITSLVESQVTMIKERQDEVLTLINEPEFSNETCWKFGEKLAEKLGIQKEIASLNDLKHVDDEAKAAPQDTDRSAKIANLKSAETVFKEIVEKRPDTSKLQDYANRYNQLCKDPEKVLWARLNELFKQAKSLLKSGVWENNTCPLCWKKILSEELLAHIKEHQDKNKETQKEISQVEEIRELAKRELSQILSFLRSINDLESLEDNLIKGPKEKGVKLAFSLANASSLLGQPLKPTASIDFDGLGLSTQVEELEEVCNRALEAVCEIQKSLSITVEETARIKAFQELNALTSHIAVLEAMETKVEPLKVQALSMRVFTSAFQDLRRNTMGVVLKEISDDVARYFLSLHPNEGFDDIRLKFLPEEDGVEFYVYYKDEEITPPRRFLSESYLSGLGVCLFLATVRAFNKKNGFVVLDDIVNSFDAEHRSDLAKLLIDEFNDQQLIVLTHDSLWFNFFRRLPKQAWQHRRITRRSYEEGIELETPPENALAECHNAINNGDVGFAAHCVRIFIESRLKNLLKKLGGRVRFREGSANEERAAGELLLELKKHLNESSFFEFADAKPFEELEASTFFTNYGSHDRLPAPAGLSVGDVEFALGRILALEEAFICPTCEKKVWNTVGRNFEMQCECGEYSLR